MNWRLTKGNPHLQPRYLALKRGAGNRENEFEFCHCKMWSSVFNIWRVLWEKDYLRTNMAVCFCLLDPIPLWGEPWSLPTQFPDLRSSMRCGTWNLNFKPKHLKFLLACNRLHIWKANVKLKNGSVKKYRWLKMSDSTESKNSLSSPTFLWEYDSHSNVQRFFENVGIGTLLWDTVLTQMINLCENVRKGNLWCPRGFQCQSGQQGTPTSVQPGKQIKIY